MLFWRDGWEPLGVFEHVHDQFLHLEANALLTKHLKPGREDLRSIKLQRLDLKITNQLLVTVSPQHKSLSQDIMPWPQSYAQASLCLYP